jgi:hypothetical protein
MNDVESQYQQIEEALPKVAPFYVDERLLNTWEKEGHYDVEWNPLSMKKFIDKWFKEDPKGWDLRKQGPLLRVQTRWAGTTALPSMPIIKFDHYFPDIEDPLVVHLAMNEFRQEWDSEIESITDMDELSNHCTYAKEIRVKPVFNFSSRQLLEKKFYFQCQEALDLSSDPESELGEGSPEDIYDWFTSLPNEVKEADRNSVRAEVALGLNIISKMSNR